jgi:hypothetical protein
MVFSWLPWLALLLCQATPAQTLYRCGNSYQDKPCAKGEPGKVVNILKPADNGGGDSGKSVAGALCSQRGLEAQKLVWAREGGAQESDALARATSERERELVYLVYRTRGSASAVRQAVEANCVAEAERGRPASAAASAAPGTAAGTPAPAQAAGSSPAPPGNTLNKASCDQLRRDMDKLFGSDAKSEQRKAFENSLKQSGC